MFLRVRDCWRHVLHAGKSADGWMVMFFMPLIQGDGQGTNKIDDENLVDTWTVDTWKQLRFFVNQCKCIEKTGILCTNVKLLDSVLYVGVLLSL